MQKSLNFDLDTNKLKELYPNKSYTQAYKDIKNFLLKNGFEHRQGSGYISKENMSELEVTDIVTNLNNKHSWLKSCCKTFDYYDVGKQYDGLSILNEKRELKDNQVKDKKKFKPKRRDIDNSQELER